MRTVLISVTALIVMPLGSMTAVRTVPGRLPAAGATTAPRGSYEIPGDYKPLHKGGVDLATGLYVRENEDLVVPGNPGLVLRRTHLANYRASKQFGVGATHNGEEYLIGDGERFQWASLILARGSRIQFRRTSEGTSLVNATYVHDETATEWQGAELRWNLLAWTLRKRDGTVLIFRGCGPGTVCSIIQATHPDGRVVHYRRNPLGQLSKMEAGPDRWIAFDYDGSGRITRASASTQREVRYEYDVRGRLTTVTSSDGTVRRYTYTDLDELATIEEPGTSIENGYASGRCVRQVNRYPDSDPLIFEFIYQLAGDRVVGTETRRSDGSFSKYTWDEARRKTSEALGRAGYDPIVFTYERDATGRAVKAVTVTCPDFGAGPLRRTKPVTTGGEDTVKAELMKDCFARLR